MKNFNTFINKLKKKDLTALDFLVENYSNIIFKVCDGILNNRELSKECTNEVLLKIWNNIDKFNKDKSKFIVWLLTIAKYTAIDKLRKESKHYNHSNITELNLSTSQNLEDDFITNEQLKLVQSFVNNMNPTDKSIFLKKFFELENSKNIGEALGLSEKLVNLKIFRIRKKLKKLFSEV